MLPDDGVIVPAQLCSGIVLTTRRASLDEDKLLETDFVGFGYLAAPMRELQADAVPGDLLIGRHLNGEIVIERALEPIPVRDEEIAAVLRAYEAETREVNSPIAFSELLLNLLGDDPTFFSVPRAPLSELVVAAGLQVRGKRIAADDSVWRVGAYHRAVYRIVDTAANEKDRRAALDVLKVFQAVVEDEPDELATPPGLRRVLDSMADYNVLSVVTEQFFGDADDPLMVDATDKFARRLSDVASRPLQRAIAAWLTALVAERRCDPAAAAEALADAVRQAPDFLPAVDRLAWTRSDQGRASESIALWRQLDPDYPDAGAIEVIMAASVNPEAQGLRRNDPCWCGSGRKFKVCHLRASDLPALPDRMTWLLRKTVGYLDRRGEPVPAVVAEVAWKLADRQSENVDKALEDPLVNDVVLHELGWLERFLAERGPILPEDEQLLFASWLLVGRSVYEIVDVKRDACLTVRDLRTGELEVVKERTLSKTALRGQMICARVLPDGRGYQFNGALFYVPPGREEMLIDILDDPNPQHRADRLLAYQAAANRPPSMVTTEGEPLRRCQQILQLHDPEHAREVLDRHYVSDGPGHWHQSHAVGGDPDKVIIRAFMRLDGSQLTIETMSEERMDRVSEELIDVFGLECRIVSDERGDLTMPDLSSAPAIGAGSSSPLPPEMKAALAGWLEQQEARWCGEPVPALGGLTPKEAAADPTRREQVIRLIDSFGPEGGVTDEGTLTMRPDRLRSLLGI